MPSNESVGSDVSRFQPSLARDDVYGQAAIAADIWSPAGGADRAAALSRTDTALPDGFPKSDLITPATAAPAVEAATAAPAVPAVEAATPAPAAEAATVAPAPVAAESGATASTPIVDRGSTALDRGLTADRGMIMTDREPVADTAIAAPTNASVADTAPGAVAAVSPTAAADLPTDSVSVPTAAGQLTADELATASQATGQIVTKYSSIDPDGKVSNMEEVGTAVNTTGADGQQYYLTDGHNVLSNGIDSQNNYSTAGPITITNSTGTFSAHVVGTDSNDLAALQLDGPVLDQPSLPIASNPQYSPGDSLTSIGYPFGQTEQAVQSTTYRGVEPVASYGPQYVHFGDNDTRSMITGDGDMAMGTSGSTPLVTDRGQVAIGGFLDMSTGGSYDNSHANALYDPDATTLYTQPQAAQDLMDTVTGIPSSLNVLPQITGTSTSGAAPESTPTTGSTTDSAVSVPATAGTALESMSSTGQAAATADEAADSSASTMATLTPAQAAVAQATVQITTPIVTVGPNGELSESKAGGTGFIVDGTDANGNFQQYVVTAAHVPAATGQDGVPNEDGETTYAEGPSTIIFNDGTRETASPIANNSSVTSTNGVQLTGNPDVAILPVPNTGPTLPYPSVQIDPNSQPSPGDSLTSFGYPGQTFTAINSTYLGLVTPSFSAPGLSDNTTYLDTSGPGVHGMSGGPVFDNTTGTVQGIVAAGNSTNTIDTPISTASTLIDGLSPFSPNYLYNALNATPQPIARPDDRGNGSDQTLRGVTITNGENSTHLDAPETTTPAPATDDPAPVAQPTDTPAPVTPPPTAADTPAPVATPDPIAADTSAAAATPAATAADTSAAAATPAASAADTSAVAAAAPTAADSAASASATTGLDTSLAGDTTIDASALASLNLSDLDYMAYDFSENYG